MAILKVNVNGTLYDIDFNGLINTPDAELPTVTASDAGKFLRVNASGEWAAATLANAEEATF